MRGVSPLLVFLTLAVVLAAGATAAAPLPGTKTAKDRAAWRAILKWPNICESDWKSAGNSGSAGIRTWKTVDGRRLVEVTCTFGAYQGVFMLYLVDQQRNATGPLVLHTYRDPGSGKPKAVKQTRSLGVATFTPKTGVLTLLDKFRGVGDCGIYSVFELTGNRFVTTEVRAKTACDGKPPYEGARWPKLPLP